MKKIFAFLLILVVAGFSFAAGQKDSGAAMSSDAGFSGNYAFGGSTTVEPIVRAAAEAYTEMNPDVKISYDAPGSSAGVKGALDGTYSIGAASRSLKSSEVDAGAVATAIAKDGVAVVVNKGSVNIDALTHDQLIGIYAGEITNWKEIGGPDGKIVVFNRDEASGTRDCFNEKTVKEAGKSFVDTAAIVTSNGDMVAKVGSTPFAIGYCGFGYLGKDAGTKSVSIEGVVPEVKYVLDGSYPIQRDLILITKGKVAAGSLEEAFINYILSDEGQAIVAEEKFIPLK